ncbi:Serine/threonine-protein kinase OXI1 [Platanthera zijinensis]|uniref:non-specific serine/threonine protein kinase n=1 Tax=Platanthera zijinensis TaxID=2320716 RepID=A0AAP0BRL5_9ASPA
MTDQSDPHPPPPPPPTIQLQDLTAISVLGRGSKGVVFLISHLSSGETFALKAISRSSLEHKNSASSSAADGRGRSAYRRICFEHEVLLSLNHPLFPSLHGVVSTENIIGFVIDHCPGGDLNALRRRQTEKMFSDDAIRFYAAELVLALEYLHQLGIAYRDLKPENVLIQKNGHLMLVDFDLSAKLTLNPLPEIQRRKPPSAQKKKKRALFKCFGIADVSPEILNPDHPNQPPLSSRTAKSNSFVGTEDYVAPEIIEGMGHDFSVDWWCLGVVLYEMLYGRTPFRGITRKETFYRILTKSPELVGEPTALRDLIGRLLEKNPGKRITGREIRRHEFFQGVDWGSLLEMARPPFIPAEVERTQSGDCLDVETVVEEIFTGARGGKGLVSDGNAAVDGKNSSRNDDFYVF